MDEWKWSVVTRARIRHNNTSRWVVGCVGLAAVVVVGVLQNNTIYGVIQCA